MAQSKPRPLRHRLVRSMACGVLWTVAGGTLLGGASAATRAVPAAPSTPATPAAAAAPADAPLVRVWQPPAGFTQQPIWPGTAPDMADAPRDPERVLSKLTPEALQGDRSEAVYDVSTPTMTVFPARGASTHAAIVVFPGGGFMALAITLEGTEVCHWLADHGITCVLSKYRVPRSNHHYEESCDCGVTPKVPRALQDAQRTIRLVRARAKSLGVDADRIGVMGFSAGGYLVAQASNLFEPAYAPVDAIDQVSSRPDFAIAFFPGHICRGGKSFDPGLKVTKRTPPTFLLQAWDDPVDDICNSTMYARALQRAGVPAEVHLFARGGHAFALRPLEHPVAIWPTLLEGWLQGQGILPRPQKPGAGP